MCGRWSVVRSNSPERRVWPVVVALLVVAASLVPMTWPTGRDSFPITPYPMFSGHKESATVHLVLAVGETGDDTLVLPTEAAGHRHVTQAARALSNAAAEGGTRVRRLCGEYAEWAADSTFADFQWVRIVTAEFDGVSYFVDDDRDPHVVTEHARCPVGT